jgi:hypothetical protein
VVGTSLYLWVRTGSLGAAFLGTVGVVYVTLWTLPMVFASAMILLVLDMARIFRSL